MLYIPELMCIIFKGLDNNLILSLLRWVASASLSPRIGDKLLVAYKVDFLYARLELR